MLKEIKIEKYDNLSDLRQKLGELDRSGNESDLRDVHQAREVVLAELTVNMNALKAYIHSRYHLGRALWAYSQHFKENRNWTAAAELIASAILRNKRTVFRMIGDYEWASQLPATIIGALLDQDIDPAAHKNAPIVEELRQLPEPETPKQAVETVARIVTEHSIAKKKKAPAKSATMDFEEFAAKFVKQLEDRYRAVTLQEKVNEVRRLFELANSTLRLQIRELRQYSRPALVPKPATWEVVA